MKESKRLDKLTKKEEVMLFTCMIIAFLWICAIIIFLFISTTISGILSLILGVTMLLTGKSYEKFYNRTVILNINLLEEYLKETHPHVFADCDYHTFVTYSFTKPKVYIFETYIHIKYPDNTSKIINDFDWTKEIINNTLNETDF